MKGFLSQKGIEYDLRDIQSDESAQAELMEMGFTAIPVTVVDDQDPILGANLKAIESALSA